jgi:uncharacterized membrane protein
MAALGRLARVLAHLRHDRADVARRFPEAALRRIEERIADGERVHGAELRFAIEPSLGLPRVWSGTDARTRALEVFGALRVWDTEANNGVLLYVLLADHAVEVVADRAAARAIDEDRWRDVARDLARAYRAGQWVDGTLASVDRVNALLAAAFPAAGHNPDELPNRPVLL